MDRTYHGSVPLRVVAGKSLNVSTARLLTEVVGVNKSYEYAQKLGLKLEPADKSPAPLALGGLTKGVSTLQMAQAYSTFVHDGMYTEAHTIIKILDVDGNLVEPKKKVKKDVKVFSKDTSRTMTRILKSPWTTAPDRMLNFPTAGTWRARREPPRAVRSLGL